MGTKVDLSQAFTKGGTNYDFWMHLFGRQTLSSYHDCRITTQQPGIIEQVLILITFHASILSNNIERKNYIL